MKHTTDQNGYYLKNQLFSCNKRIVQQKATLDSTKYSKESKITGESPKIVTKWLENMQKQFTKRFMPVGW